MLSKILLITFFTILLKVTILNGILYFEEQDECAWHSECHSSGVSLILPAAAVSNLSRNWFPLQLNYFKIIKLQVDLELTEAIEEEVFSMDVFSAVKHIEINNLQLSELPEWTFIGLKSLEELIMTDTIIDSYANGVLGFVSNTLTSFRLTERHQSRNVSITPLLGGNSARLFKLQFVKIQYNLYTIDRFSFTGIPFVNELDLSDCYIQIIDENTFDFALTLKLLNLERNRLTTLPANIFSNLNLISMLLDNHGVTLRLRENKFNCDCSLDYLEQFLVDNLYFEREICCKTSFGVRNNLVREDDVCKEDPTTEDPTTEDPTTEDPTTEDPTTEDSTTTTEDSTTTTDHINITENIIEKQCLASNGTETYDKISIQTHTYQIQFTLQSEEVIVRLNHNLTDLVLMWFSSDQLSYEYHQSDIVSCVRNISNEIVVNNLQQGVVYTFCLMNQGDTTMSPLNCMSYHHRKIDKVFLHKSNQNLTIVIVTIVLGVSIIAGIAIGIILLRSTSNNNHISSHPQELPYQLPIEAKEKCVVSESLVNDLVPPASRPPPPPPPNSSALHPELELQPSPPPSKGHRDEDGYYYTVNELR